MENKQMADYTLTIKADSGYESEIEGRCTAEQYGQAIAALHGETPQRTWVGLTPQERDEITNTVMIDIWQVARAVEAKLKAKNERKEKNTND